MCAQLSYTVQHKTVLIVFPLILRTMPCTELNIVLVVNGSGNGNKVVGMGENGNQNIISARH